MEHTYENLKQPPDSRARRIGGWIADHWHLVRGGSGEPSYNNVPDRLAEGIANEGWDKLVDGTYGAIYASRPVRNRPQPYAFRYGVQSPISGWSWHNASIVREFSQDSTFGGKVCGLLAQAGRAVTIVDGCGLYVPGDRLIANESMIRQVGVYAVNQGVVVGAAAFDSEQFGRMPENNQHDLNDIAWDICNLAEELERML